MRLINILLMYAASILAGINIYSSIVEKSSVDAAVAGVMIVAIIINAIDYARSER